LINKFSVSANRLFTRYTAPFVLILILLILFGDKGMAKNKKTPTPEAQPKKRGGRQSGAKTYNKHTLLKLIKKYKPTNTVLWSTVSEQYRVECGELEARPPLVIKRFFITKMCNNQKKPTGATGIDDMTAQSQSLYREMTDEQEAYDEGDESSDQEALFDQQETEEVGASEFCEDQSSSSSEDE
jgi:hypothetical protein